MSSDEDREVRRRFDRRSIDVLEPLLPKPHSCGRPHTDRQRYQLDSLCYLTRDSMADAPGQFSTVAVGYHIFRRWVLDHTWEAINDGLRVYLRQQGLSRPTVAILNRQIRAARRRGGLRRRRTH